MKKVLVVLMLCIISITMIHLTSCISGSGDIDNNDETVYVTPNGKAYHSSRACAGKNSYAIKRSKVGNRKPCKKCM